MEPIKATYRPKCYAGDPEMGAGVADGIPQDVLIVGFLPVESETEAKAKAVFIDNSRESWVLTSSIDSLEPDSD